MKYIRSNFKEYKISVDDAERIKHSLDLYDMYLEYTKECDKILIKIKDLNSKLDANENEVMEYIDHKNKLISENEFSKLSLDLQKNLDEAYKYRDEFTDLINKFNIIDSTKDQTLKAKLISELKLKEGYRKFKNNTIRANNYNNKFIDNILKKKTEIEENFNIVGEETISVNKDVIKDFNKKISSINSKIARNKDSIKKYNKNIKGLISELNNSLNVYGFENVNVYKDYLHNLNFSVKKY